jgi:hypothetical protein
VEKKKTGQAKTGFNSIPLYREIQLVRGSSETLSYKEAAYFRTCIGTEPVAYLKEDDGLNLMIAKFIKESC